MTDTALPRYMQVSEALIREIGAGRRAEGSRLPPERDLAADYDVSVGTLRKALDRLDRMGLVDRVHGSGNYIRGSVKPAGVYAFFKLERLEGGGLPTADLISVDRRATTPDLREPKLSFEAHRIRRVRRLDDVPAALEEIWVDGRIVDRIDPAALSESLYLYYREVLGLKITRTEDRVSLGVVPDWGGANTTMRPGDPAVFVERRATAEGGERVEVSRTWVDSREARYVARFRNEDIPSQ